MSPQSETERSEGKPARAGVFLLLQPWLGHKGGMPRTGGGIIPNTANPKRPVKPSVDNAISRYESDGLDATLSYYNTRESMDGQ